MAEIPIEPTDIVITASLAEEERADTAASATVIEAERIDRLGEPLLSSYLRLTPSASVSASGPAGSLTQVRIRGAEANHSLLFVDGIRINDPASGNEPRFELLNADLASRIEVVRGPQSALWGSEAVGGVVAVNGLRAETPGLSVQSETGSFGFRRASASGAWQGDGVNAHAAAGWQHSDGIDAFDGTGDRDGYRNLSGRAGLSWKPSDSLEIGANMLALTGRSQFDGYDPFTFLRADTLDSSRNRLGTGRIWAQLEPADRRWTGQLSASLLGSSNRNFLEGQQINRTSGRRLALAAKGEHEFAAAGAKHRLIVAAEQENERFSADDEGYFGATEQDRSRSHQSLTGQWTAQAGRLVGDIALRHDRFSAFTDSTSLRASLLAKLGDGFSVAASYGEGIAQPSFFDLYGFFPENFQGNSELKPESSQSIEASVRYRRGSFNASITGYRQRLKNEIVDIFDASTFLSSTANRSDRSRRSGLELDLGWALTDGIRLSGQYALLDATEPGGVADTQVRELRRPRHSGSIAIDGRRGPLSYGLALSYAGDRFDSNFDVIPAERVRLDAYWLGSARLAYRIADGLELFARGSNLLDQRYEEVFANRTEGRAFHAGIRLGRGD